MATTATYQPKQIHDRPSNRKEKRSDIWASLLRQTRQAQARNRSNAIADRQLVICGGSPADQREFAESLARPPPPLPPRRGADQRDRERDQERGKVTLSNRSAYGYGHVTLYTPAPLGVGGFAQEADEAARVEVHTIPDAEAGFEPVLRRILVPRMEEKDAAEDEEEGGGGELDSLERASGKEKHGRRPSVAILLSWNEPWLFLDQLRAWLQLLARAVQSASPLDSDPLDVLKEADLGIAVIVQHVEAQQVLEREGWSEETFDYVSQVLRTAILPLHPSSLLLFLSSSAPAQQPGSALSQMQRAIFQLLDLELATLSPKSAASGTTAKPEEMQARHNVVDRMNILVPQAWDSVGKIRLLSEDFSPEEMLAAWQSDLSHSIFPLSIPVPADDSIIKPSAPHTTSGATRPEEEVFEASTIPSPIDANEDSLPPTPSKSVPIPSAIRTFTAQIVDPNAHKRPKPPTITLTTRSEQEFLAEMKLELDALATKDRAATPNGTRTIVGLPQGDSTGALNSLGDVSFNVGGVSYNTVSAEQAIERLKRPPIAAESPSPSSVRGSTPRPPRRAGESRDVTPSAPSVGNGKGDFPAEDLERYFASLAKKAGGGDSRAGTPGRG